MAEPRWLEVSLTVNGELAESVAEVLDRFASGGVVVESGIIFDQEDGEGTLAVTLKHDGRMIGQAGLQLYVLPWTPFATPEVELYYKLGRAYWGAGYALEACHALLRYAFDEMRLLRIITVKQPANRRPTRLLERRSLCIAPAPDIWRSEVVAIRTNPLVGS